MGEATEGLGSMNSDEILRVLNGPAPTNQGEGLLHLLKANPSLLDPAPEDRAVWSAAMDHRAYDEKHPCLRCGSDAQNAIIASTPDRPRFLDLCHGCKRWLMDQMNEAEMRPW